jgi:hypothetical protein
MQGELLAGRPQILANGQSVICPLMVGTDRRHVKVPGYIDPSYTVRL